MNQSEQQVIGLFPSPLMIFSYLDDYSKELDWIKKCKCEKDPYYNKQSVDTFILDNPELKNIRIFIEDKLDQFVSQIYGSKNKLVITQSWVNKSGKGESHHEHTHPNSVISGVWYPQINENLPPIEFRNKLQRDMELSIDQYNCFNSGIMSLPVQRGQLILFPSNISHGVAVNRINDERISLSFNTWVKGNLGSIDTLTYLPLDKIMA